MVTVHTTLPIRTASQGVSFAFKELYLNPTRNKLVGFLCYKTMFEKRAFTANICVKTKKYGDKILHEKWKTLWIKHFSAQHKKLWSN